MLGGCWQTWVLRAGRRPHGQPLASVPVVSVLKPGVKVVDPPCLLGGEEGSSDGVSKALGVGLQQDGGASRQLQGPGSQGSGGVGALGGQQRAARGDEAELPLEGVVSREEGALRRRLVEEEGDEAQDCVRSLQRGDKGQVNRQTLQPVPVPHHSRPLALLCRMGTEVTQPPASWALRGIK